MKTQSLPHFPFTGHTLQFASVVLAASVLAACGGDDGTRANSNASGSPPPTIGTPNGAPPPTIGTPSGSPPPTTGTPSGSPPATIDTPSGAPPATINSGGTPPSNAAPQTTILGTIAVGKALSNSNVQLICASGGANTQADANGKYSATFTFTAPCLITASGTDNGSAVTLRSIAPASGTANVTPLTDLLVVTLAKQLGSSSVSDLGTQIVGNRTIQNALSNSQTIAKAQSAVLSLVSSYGGAVSNSTDFLRVPFNANHTGMDADLDNLRTAGIVDTTTGMPKSDIQTAAQQVGQQLASNNDAPVITNATIGGTLTGFSAGWKTVSLLNGSDTLGLSNNGAFTFLAPVALHKAYNVTIQAQPLWQTCLVTNGSGVLTGPVNNIGVSCNQNQAVVSTLATQDVQNPYDIAFDSISGQVYIADYNNNAVIKMDRNGNGTPFVQFQGKSPFSLAVDKNGNVYTVNDDGSISMVTPQGVITTIATLNENTAGDGIGVDGAGNVYVANTTSVYKIDASTRALTLIAGSDTTKGFRDGAGPAARFNFISDLAVTSHGAVFVADMGNYVIRKIAPDGTVTTIAGTPGTPGYRDGAAGQSLMGGYLQANGNLKPVTYDANGVANTTGDSTYHLTVNAAGVWVTDSTNNVVRLIDPSGTVTTVAGTRVQARRSPSNWWSTQQMKDGVGTAANFVEPFGIATNTATGELYVGGFNSNAIRKITPVASQ